MRSTGVRVVMVETWYGLVPFFWGGQTLYCDYAYDRVRHPKMIVRENLLPHMKLYPSRYSHDCRFHMPKAMQIQ